MATRKKISSPQAHTSGLAISLRNRPRRDKHKGQIRSKYFESPKEDEPAGSYPARFEDTRVGRLGDEMVRGNRRARDGHGAKNKRKPGIAFQGVDKQRKKAKLAIGQTPRASPTGDSEGLGAESVIKYQDNMIHPNTMTFLKGKKFALESILEGYLMFNITWIMPVQRYLCLLQNFRAREE